MPRESQLAVEDVGKPVILIYPDSHNLGDMLRVPDRERNVSLSYILSSQTSPRSFYLKRGDDQMNCSNCDMPIPQYRILRPVWHTADRRVTALPHQGKEAIQRILGQGLGLAMWYIPACPCTPGWLFWN